MYKFIKMTLAVFVFGILLSFAGETVLAIDNDIGYELQIDQPNTALDGVLEIDAIDHDIGIVTVSITKDYIIPGNFAGTLPRPILSNFCERGITINSNNHPPGNVMLNNTQRLSATLNKHTNQVLLC